MQLSWETATTTMKRETTSRKRARESQETESDLEVVLDAKSDKLDRRQLMNAQLELEQLRSSWSADVRKAAEEERGRNEAKIEGIIAAALEKRDAELMELKAALGVSQTELLTAKLRNSQNATRVNTVAQSDLGASTNQAASSEVMVLRSELRAMTARAEEAQALSAKAIDELQAQASQRSQSVALMKQQLQEAKLEATKAVAAQAKAEQETSRTAADLAATKNQLSILTRELKEVRARMNQANATAAKLGTDMDLLKIRVGTGKVANQDDQTVDQLLSMRTEMEKAKLAKTTSDRKLQETKTKLAEALKADKLTRTELNKVIKDLRSELKLTKALLNVIPKRTSSAEAHGEPELSPEPESEPEPEPKPAAKPAPKSVPKPAPIHVPSSAAAPAFASKPEFVGWAPAASHQPMQSDSDSPSLIERIKTLEVQLQVEKQSAGQYGKEVWYWKEQSQNFEALLIAENRKLVDLQTGLSRGTVVGSAPLAVTAEEVSKRFEYDAKALRSVWLKNDCLDRSGHFQPPREILAAVSNPSDPATRVGAALQKWKDPRLRRAMAVWFAHRWAFANVIGLAITYPHMVENLEAVKLAEQLCLKDKLHRVKENM